VAAAVLAGGALWPAAGDDLTVTPSSPPTAPTAPAPPSATNSGTPSASAEHDPHPEPTGPADLAAVGAELLDARAACGKDDVCLSEVVVDPSTPLGGGAIDLPPAERTVTLLDDFGDVAVLRVDAIDASLPAQLTVLMRSDEKWLLRDVHDVAQQPE
jgi:hypothetical protein